MRLKTGQMYEIIVTRSIMVRVNFTVRLNPQKNPPMYNKIISFLFEKDLYLPSVFLSMQKYPDYVDVSRK
jgi:hypothetical protein